MKTVYDTQVKNFLYDYESSLRNKRGYTNIYARSKERRKEKVSNFRKYLQSLGTQINHLPVCDKK